VTRNAKRPYSNYQLMLHIYGLVLNMISILCGRSLIVDSADAGFEDSRQLFNHLFDVVSMTLERYNILQLEAIPAKAYDRSIELCGSRTTHAFTRWQGGFTVAVLRGVIFDPNPGCDVKDMLLLIWRSA
jgi:hypothetical protein